MPEPKPRRDLAALPEKDVVRFFGEALEHFVLALGGSYESHDVARYKGGVYPSDQDYAGLLPAGKLIPKDGPFSLHLFALQFKRWETGVWDIFAEQNDTLRSMSHVIAYALPRPEETPPENGLHCFNFVNPSFLPADTDRLLLQNSAYNPEVAAVITDRPEERWVVPHMSWGELFGAILAGGIKVQLLRDQTPRRGDDGGDDDDGGPSGFGLCYVGDGPWHSEYIQAQLIDHLEFWCDNFLAGRSAMVACESFSKSFVFLDLDLLAEN
ncbi:MAG: hypothetical protein QGH60_02715 [Phycisphaerae bacterium]|jgi:hypothetical protein|nr:hypothetical protein [Phycisphaerae bacterium]